MSTPQQDNSQSAEQASTSPSMEWETTDRDLSQALTKSSPEDISDRSTQPEEETAFEDIEVQSSPKPKRWQRVVVAGILLAVGLGGIPLVYRNSLRSQPDTAKPQQNLPTILPVETITVETVNSYSVARAYTGIVEAQRTSELSFEQSGLLRSLSVDQGQQVNQGEVMARLDTRQLQAQRQGLIAQKDQAIATLTELQNGPRQETIAATRSRLTQEQARLRELQAGPRTENIDAAGSRLEDLQQQLELAQLQTQRRRDLYAEGAISREDLDQTITTEDSLLARINEAESNLTELQTGTRIEQIQAQQAQVQQVRSQLDELLAGTRIEQIQAQQAQVRQIESQISELEILLEKSLLSAPFSGQISRRYIDEGTVVSAGQQVVRLVEGRQPEVRVGVPAEALSDLRIGRQYPVEVGGEVYSAGLISILPEVDSATRTRTVILLLPQIVAPGTIGRLQLTRIQSTEGFWLPTSALIRGERGLWACYALVAVENSTDIPPRTKQLERRTVEVLHTEGERSLVRGLLQPGEQVVANGVQQFVPGQWVEVLLGE
ncbi:MAG: efflux RND transporter periplasmic adaptor subunit [Microcoleaceae cyanobacterium]